MKNAGIFGSGFAADGRRCGGSSKYLKYIKHNDMWTMMVKIDCQRR